MTSRMEGFDELQRNIENMAGNLREIQGTNQVPMSEALTPEFLSLCFRFVSLEEMFSASGFKVDSPEDFKAIPDDEWNAFIRQHTRFDTWQEMLGKTGAVWAKNHLGR
ncbi:MAG TPA: hypothetical protein VGJ89_06045 [Geothrix sp.]